MRETVIRNYWIKSLYSLALVTTESANLKVLSTIRELKCLFPIVFFGVPLLASIFWLKVLNSKDKY